MYISTMIVSQKWISTITTRFHAYETESADEALEGTTGEPEKRCKTTGYMFGRVDVEKPKIPKIVQNTDIPRMD